MDKIKVGTYEVYYSYFSSGDRRVIVFGTLSELMEWLVENHIVHEITITEKFVEQDATN